MEGVTSFLLKNQEKERWEPLVTLQLSTMRDPSYATGGEGSEVTQVFDGGARNETMIFG